MKKVRWLVGSSLVIFLFLSANLSAEEIGILPFRTTGVESYTEDAFYQLLEDELAYYDHRVVSPYEIEHYLGGRVICYNKDYAADYGSSLGLEKVIFGSITRLGEKYVISVEVVKSRTGEVLLFDKTTLENEDYLEDYVYSLVDAIEEEVYDNVVYYSPTYSRTVTRVYIGGYWRPRIIWRRPYRPHRSLISVRLPLININLGKPHRVVYKAPQKRKPVYEVVKNVNIDHGKPSPGKPDYGKPKNEKPKQGNPKNEKPNQGKPKDGKQGQGKTKNEKEGHGKSQDGKSHGR
jgi:gamma-glutamylcyclotransferase (GGCT)/AIG2-like uncharacterized protein YtfP